MRDFYEFDEDRYQQRSSIKAYIAIALIFALLGAAIAYAISSNILGTDPGKMAGKDNDPGTVTEETDEKESIILGFADDLLIDENNPIVDIAEKVEGAVVGITSTKEIMVQDFFFNIQRRRTAEGYGSGIIISDQGHILTNHHVIENARELYVVLSGGETVEAKVIGTDPKSDIAVIKIEHDDLTVAKIGDSDKVRKGEFAVTIGNPLSGHELAGTVNFGIISATDRVIQVDNRTLEVLQTDAAINHGNSGGALVNMKGEVIGMNTAKLAGESVEGLGFSIPSNVFMPIARELIEKGTVEREGQPWIGIINPADITQSLSEEFGYPVGILVREVYPGGPAENAGIKPGDVIVAYDGKKVKTLQELKAAIAENKVGQVVEIELVRGETEIVFKLKLGDISVIDS